MEVGSGPTAVSQCRRFDRTGVRCVNQTPNADGWCRSGGCPGYVRPLPVVHDDDHPRAPRGTAKHIAATGARRLSLDLDEVESAGISQRARDAFRFHHHGSDQEAATQLRAMLEDFLLRSARSKSRNGYVVLAREGYELVLDPSLTVITGYETVHRERTWEQGRLASPPGMVDPGGNLDRPLGPRQSAALR